MSVFLHQIFYANNKFGSQPDTGNPDDIYPYPLLDELSKWAIIKPIYVSPFVRDSKPSTQNPDGALERQTDKTTLQQIRSEGRTKDLEDYPEMGYHCSRTIDEPDESHENNLSSTQRYTNSSFAKLKVVPPCSENTAIYYDRSSLSKYSNNVPINKTSPVSFTNKPRLPVHPRIPSNLSIFQSMFLLHYGYSEYIMVGHRMLNRELEEKQKIMETLSKTPKKLKEGNHKLTNDNIQEILSGLLVATKEEIMHLVAYSAYYNRIIYLVFTHSYLVFSPTKDTTVDSTNIQSVYILNQTRKHPKYGGSYYPELEPTLETLENIHNSKIHLEHYAKPFKGISAYKLPELEEMAKKTGVFEKEVPIKYKKKELYDKIVEVCCSGICA